ncbi:MAG: DUF3570 domain-containing protein [Enterobacterales bacterium]|nr:DUF3570 domain-containing protein [Enterobacterales bacterium]
MQLINRSISNKADKNNHLVEKLALAATALLGAGAHSQDYVKDAADLASEWNIAASSLLYSEIDRVSAAEFIISGNKDFHDTGNFDFKIVLDTLTGSSPNGAIEQNTAQTFTRPSGGEEGEITIQQYTIGANTTPLDDAFQDLRVQSSFNWIDSFSEDYRYSMGGNFSKELDYTSVSANLGLEKDLFQKNTTLSIGFSGGSDSYEPTAGIPDPMQPMLFRRDFSSRSRFTRAFKATRGNLSGSISTSEVLLGWTQVVSRRMLTQFNLGISNSSGYLNDPFKVISLLNTQGAVQEYIYEGRPDQRTKKTFFALTKYHLEESVFDLSYRYMTDDWNIQSHTFDTHWLFFTDSGDFWQPHFRFYHQSAADFYTPFLVQGNPVPTYATSDYRVGEMDAVTLGLKYGMQLANNHRFEMRLEYYTQSPIKANQPTGIANLDGLDLYPKVNAIIFQMSYYL